MLKLTLPGRPLFRQVRLLLAVVILLALFCPAIGQTTAPSSQAQASPEPPAPPEPPVPAPAPALTPADAMRLRRTPVVEVFQACKDAVVNISATQIVKVQSPGIDSLFDQLFEFPNGNPFNQTQEYKATSVGSGFVIHPAGYIVTNAHVVNRTVDRKVIFADKHEYEARIVAIDAQRDLAILKIDVDHPIKPLKLGHSADLMIGETAIAIGNPLGYQHTVTAGVVSALDRSIDVGNGAAFKGLIQTDASINPGNSGGPLLNILGELIGINTAIRGDAQNIGFAIPVDFLRQSLPEMLDVERRYRIVTGLMLAADGGAARIVHIVGDSPAAAAGLEPGDVLIRFDGQPISTVTDFDIALIGRKAGDSIKLVWMRGDKALENTLKLAGRPRPDGAKLLSQKLGLETEAVTTKYARSLGLRELHGLLVTKVESDGPADNIGFRKGDIIDQLAGTQAGTLDEAGDLLEQVKVGDHVPVSVLRIRGNTVFRTKVTVPVR